MQSMKGWIKHFIDGSQEDGSDLLITQGKASWRNGCLDNIISVDIRENGYLYSLICKDLGDPPRREWWQGDNYHSRFIPNQTVPGVCVLRFVQFKILPEDTGKYLHMIKLPHCYQMTLKNNPQGALTQIDPKSEGMWLTLEIEPGKEIPGIKIKANRG